MCTKIIPFLPVHLKLLWFSPYHCCPPQRWDPEYSGNNVSTRVGSCPDRLRPTLWSWCSCIRQFRRWNLQEKLPVSVFHFFCWNILTSFTLLYLLEIHGLVDISTPVIIRKCEKIIIHVNIKGQYLNLTFRENNWTQIAEHFGPLDSLYAL